MTTDTGQQLSAVLINVSAGGAKLQLDGELQIPNAFHLACDDVGMSADVVVIWKLGALVGVRLLRDAATEPPVAERRAVTVYRPSSAADPEAVPEVQ